MQRGISQQQSMIYFLYMAFPRGSYPAPQPPIQSQLTAWWPFNCLLHATFHSLHLTLLAMIPSLKGGSAKVRSPKSRAFPCRSYSSGSTWPLLKLPGGAVCSCSNRGTYLSRYPRLCLRPYLAVGSPTPFWKKPESQTLWSMWLSFLFRVIPGIRSKMCNSTYVLMYVSDIFGCWVPTCRIWIWDQICHNFFTFGIVQHDRHTPNHTWSTMIAVEWQLGNKLMLFPDILWNYHLHQKTAVHLIYQRRFSLASMACSSGQLLRNFDIWSFSTAQIARSCKN